MTFFPFDFFSAGQDFQEHQSALQILERRWQALYTQIVQAERELEQTASSSKFDDEFQQLTQTMAEYDKWIENNSSIVNSAEIQAKFKSFQSLNDRLTNLRRLADRLNNSAVQRTEQLVRSWDENIVRLREYSHPIDYWSISICFLLTKSTGHSRGKHFTKD